MVTIGQAITTAEKLEGFKKQAAEEAIAKYKAQLDAQKKGMLTAAEVDAAAALVKSAAAAKAEAKAARKPRENTRAAIENSADKIVPPPTRVEEISEYSEESDPEVQKQDNYAEWQRKQYKYSVKATLKVDTHTGQRVRWSNRIGTENWVKDNFGINFLLMELHEAMDQHNLIGDLYNNCLRQIYVLEGHQTSS